MYSTASLSVVEDWGNSLKISLKLFLVRKIAAISSWSGSIRKSVIRDFSIETIKYERLIEEAKHLSPSEALAKKNNLVKKFGLLDTLDRLVSRSGDKAMIEGFKGFKKKAYKYEAILHKVSLPDVDHNHTPDYVLDGLSKFAQEAASIK